MNSTSRRMPNLASNASLAAFVAALLLSTASGAFAQASLNIPGTSAPPPPVAAAAPAAIEIPAPQPPANLEPQAVVQPAPQLPPMPAAARPAAPTPAAMPAQPQRPGALPNRQVDQQLERATNEAVQRLNQVSPEGLSSADPSAIASELDRQTVQQRKLRELELLNKQAEQVQKLYKTVYGDDAKIGQPAQGTTQAKNVPQITEEEVRKRVEQARADALKEADELRVQKEREELLLGPRPVVAQIIGTSKKRQAVVMLPCDRGSITVSVGNRLTQGDNPMRVMSISEEGVEVSQKGNRFMLGFGNTSAKCSPVGNLGPRPAQTTSAAPAGSYPVPLMGGPLQISGGARMR